MRRILLVIFCAWTLVACQHKGSQSDGKGDAMKENKSEIEVIGADEDSRGCKRSAGYTWSQLRGDCIRMIEEGLALLSVEMNELVAVYVAFVLYSEVNTEIKLILL